MRHTPDELSWTISSFSDTTNCVQVARDGNMVLVGDDKLPDDPPLRFTNDEWAAFVDGVKAGEFDEL